jgi:hypothetical protein
MARGCPYFHDCHGRSASKSYPEIAEYRRSYEVFGKLLISTGPIGAKKCHHIFEAFTILRLELSFICHEATTLVLDSFSMPVVLRLRQTFADMTIYGSTRRNPRGARNNILNSTAPLVTLTVS